MSLGIGEMILLAGIALVVIGPEKFPEFAKILLRTIRDLRGYMDGVKYDLSRELRPVKRGLENAMRPDPTEVPYEQPRHAKPRLSQQGDLPDAPAPAAPVAGQDAGKEEAPRKPPPASDGYDD